MRPRRVRAKPLRLRFSQRFECKHCNLKFEQPEPRLFSFNNPYGACPRCQGFGNTIDFDMDLVIPDKSKTLAEGAVEPWTKPKYRPLGTEMRRVARLAGIPLDVPWANLKKEQQQAHSGRRRKMVWGARLLRTSGEEEVQAARAGLPEPLSRLFAVRRLRRSEAAQRGAAGQNRAGWISASSAAKPLRQAARFFQELTLTSRGGRHRAANCWRRFATACAF